MHVYSINIVNVPTKLKIDIRSVDMVWPVR